MKTVFIIFIVLFAACSNIDNKQVKRENGTANKSR